MLKISRYTKILVMFVGTLFILILSTSASAYVMNSNNYSIEKDSINVGGLDIGESSNYNLKDTMGELGTDESESSNYIMKAGYRQMNETYIALSVPSSINLGPNISGESGAATGDGTWTVNTDSMAGYYLSLKADSTPAMQSGANSFSDYTPASAGTPDYNWGLNGAGAEFGYSPYNANSQTAKFKNNGSSCNNGAAITDEKCWYGLSTSYEQITNKTSRTNITGEETKINFKAEVSSAQAAGTYTATVIVTAVSN